MKKNLDYYAGLPYREVIEVDPAGGYVGYIPELRGCITQGETKAEILEMLEDAKKAWISTALDDGMEIPEPLREEDFSDAGKSGRREPEPACHVSARERAEDGGFVKVERYLARK